MWGSCAKHTQTGVVCRARGPRKDRRREELGREDLRKIHVCFSSAPWVLAGMTPTRHGLPFTTGAVVLFVLLPPCWQMIEQCPVANHHRALLWAWDIPCLVRWRRCRQSCTRAHHSLGCSRANDRWWLDLPGRCRNRLWWWLGRRMQLSNRCCRWLSSPQRQRTQTLTRS